MSSLSPIGSPTPVSGVEPSTMASPPPAAYLHGTLDGVANMLSMSPVDLRSELKQGSSVADLAAQGGVSRNSVVQYIEQQVQSQRTAQGKTPIDANVLDQVTNSAVDRQRRSRPNPTAASAQPVPSQTASAGTPSVDLLA